MISLSSDCESPETLLLFCQLKKREDVSIHGGHGRGEAGSMQTYAAHDLSAAVGTVGIPREGPRVRQVRIVEHLEHHDRAFWSANQMHTAQKRRFSLGSHGWHIQSA